MLSRSIVESQLEFTLNSVEPPQGLGPKYEGKVRDCFVLGDRRILVATDRLSAFDVVLTTIPFKGQLLTETACHWFAATEHIVGNHLLNHPHPNVMVTRNVEIIPVEVIVRGYLTGSAWRDYTAGRAVSGISLPAGLKRSQRFDVPLITPSTKAERGSHDEPISSEEVVRSGLVSRSIWDEVCRTALKLFEFGAIEAERRGLILVDTKYEFGLLKKDSGVPDVLLADEVHTQDSSRFWIRDGYEERVRADKDPEMLDKEFVRRRLLEQGYSGEGTPPEIPDDFRVDTALRYIEAFEIITGARFEPQAGPVKEGLNLCLEQLAQEGPPAG